MILFGVGSACGGTTVPAAPGTAPTPMPTTTAPSCPPSLTCAPLAFELSGIATDDDGRPVPNANITVYPYVFGTSVAPAHGMTDGSGFYNVGFNAMRDAVGGIGGAAADKAGYEHDGRYLFDARTQDVVQNFHLYRIWRINPGMSVSVTVLPDDPFCGFDDEWRCRTLRITAPADGVMKVEALPKGTAVVATGLELYVPCRACLLPRRCCSPSASIPVAVGEEVVANILVFEATKESQSFTVGTSFEKQ
jgi:hypothetical protein